MKLYIITIDDVYDFEGFAHKPIVCLTKKEAQAELARIKREAKKDCDFDTVDSSPRSFSMYNDGTWGTSHYDAIIDVVEVPNIKKVAC